MNMPAPPRLDSVFLSTGSHATRESGLCAMEYTAWIAGEEHSDNPACVSPILAGFCRSFNDALDDTTRQRLRPYLARCIGTAGDGMDTERGFMCLDWLVRTYTPAWLDLAGLMSEGSRLRGLAPIVDLSSARAAGPLVRAAGDVAADAARDAAGDAAGTLRGPLRGPLRGTLRGTLGRCAGRCAGRCDAARCAGRCVGRCGDAAGVAAGDALAPTVKSLQASAFDLLDRMLPNVPVDMPAEIHARAAAVCDAA
jgi:hypothetical protein